MYFNESYALLLQQLETRVSFLENELTAALEEEKSLLDVANSFVPPGARRDQEPGARSRRAIGAIAAVAADAELVLGEPIKMLLAMRCQYSTSVKTTMLCHEMWTTSCAHRTQLSKISNVCKRETIKISSHWETKSKEHRKVFAS